jgi:glycine dehydrogenase subunit 2
VRYSWEDLTRETGVHTEDIGLRAADFGVHYWMSHHPWIVKEPCTLEPTESYSKADLDEYATVLRHVAEEARTDPERVRTAPHNSTVHRINAESLDAPALWAITWRAYRRKLKERTESVRVSGNPAGGVEGRAEERGEHARA